MSRNLLLVCCSLFVCLTYAQDFKVGKIDKSWFAKSLTEDQREAPAVFLEKYRRTHFEYRDNLDGWTLFTTVHNVIKILDTDGLDYANQKIRIYREGREDQKIDRIEGLSYRLVGGKVQKEKLKNSNIIINDINKYVSEIIIPIPSVQVGSIIEYSYRLKSTFWNIRDLIIQEDIPIKHLYAKIEIPQFFDYSKYVSGYLTVNPKLTIEERNENFSVEAKNPFGGKIANRTNFANIRYKETVAEYQFSDVPPLVIEPMVNNINNYRSKVSYELGAVEFQLGKKVKRSKSWGQVAAYFFDNLAIGEKLTNTKFLDDDVKRIKNEAISLDQRLQLAYATIQDRMTWASDDKLIRDPDLSKAYVKRVGTAYEINLILVALLKRLGIPSDPIMASTKDNGVPVYPTIDGFNYILAGVKNGNSWTVLDATEKNIPLGVLPERILNWEGRLVTKDGKTEAIPLFSNRYSEKKSMVIASIEGGSVNGKVRSMFSENEGLTFTRKYKQLSDQSRLERLNEDYKVEQKEDVKYKFSDLTNPKPVTVSFSFQDQLFIEEIGDKLYIQPQLFLNRKKNPFTSNERKYPIDLKYPTNTDNTVTLNIPEGYKIISLPQEIELTMANNLGTYRFVVKSNNGRSVQTLSSLTLSKTLINPENYKEIKDFYTQIVAKEKETIVLEKI